MTGVAGQPGPTPDDVLAAIPHREPFRFIDAISEVDADHVVAHYRFREDAPFYRGHFPGRPVTPGVLLVETMAQAGVVALGVYLVARERGVAALAQTTPLFTDANVEFTGMVAPGERVTVAARRVYFRHGKLRADATLYRADGSVACSGTLSGMLVSA
jgi:3-hydroxyacyl-[acyl-carrier-protein] dehydratase